MLVGLNTWLKLFSHTSSCGMFFRGGPKDRLNPLSHSNRVGVPFALAPHYVGPYTHGLMSALGTSFKRSDTTMWLLILIPVFFKYSSR